MKTLLTKVVFAALFAAVGMGFLPAPAKADNPQYHVVSIDVPGEPSSPRRLFYYYPDTRVYYDPETIAYYWQKGGHWVAGARLPSDIVLLPGQHVVFSTNVARPYMVHDRVVAIPTSEYYYRNHGSQVPRYYRPPLRYRNVRSYYREYPRRYQVYPPYWYYREFAVESKSPPVYREYPFHYRYYSNYGRDYDYYRFYPTYPRYPRYPEVTPYYRIR